MLVHVGVTGSVLQYDSAWLHKHLHLAVFHEKTGNRVDRQAQRLARLRSPTDETVKQKGPPMRIDLLLHAH